MREEDLISAFHDLWDNFPGLARLIDDRHRVLASNHQAAEAGFIEGCTCSSVGDVSLHKGCKQMEALRQGEAIVDTEIDGRLRGWIPVKSQEGVCVHFALRLPQ